MVLGAKGNQYSNMPVQGFEMGVWSSGGHVALGKAATVWRAGYSGGRNEIITPSFRFISDLWSCFCNRGVQGYTEKQLWLCLDG